MSLETPIKVEKLRMALHAKAKEEPEFRFYQLYDKLYRSDVLEFAYRVSRSNKGGAGIDGTTFEQIDSDGVERWLGELTQELKQKTYRADPLKRVWLEKGKRQRIRGYCIFQQTGQQCASYSTVTVPHNPRPNPLPQSDQQENEYTRTDQACSPWRSLSECNK